jgi:hypothetical protein
MTHQQFVNKYRGIPYKRLCDCGRPATHKYGGYECDYCKHIRTELDKHAKLRGLQIARASGCVGV